MTDTELLQFICDRAEPCGFTGGGVALNAHLWRLPNCDFRVDSDLLSCAQKSWKDRQIDILIRKLFNGIEGLVSEEEAKKFEHIDQVMKEAARVISELQIER